MKISNNDLVIITYTDQESKRRFLKVSHQPTGINKEIQLTSSDCPFLLRDGLIEEVKQMVLGEMGCGKNNTM